MDYRRPLELHGMASRGAERCRRHRGPPGGGGVREDDYEELVKRIHEHGLKTEDFDWFLDLRKYGSVPHAGFGLGLERTVAWLCGLPHVRETIPFPRMMSRLKP